MARAFEPTLDGQVWHLSIMQKQKVRPNGPDLKHLYGGRMPNILRSRRKLIAIDFEIVPLNFTEYKVILYVIYISYMRYRNHRHTTRRARKKNQRKKKSKEPNKPDIYFALIKQNAPGRETYTQNSQLRGQGTFLPTASPILLIVWIVG